MTPVLPNKNKTKKKKKQNKKKKNKKKKNKKKKKKQKKKKKHANCLALTRLRAQYRNTPPTPLPCKNAVIFLIDSYRLEEMYPYSLRKSLIR